MPRSAFGMRVCTPASPVFPGAVLHTIVPEPGFLPEELVHHYLYQGPLSKASSSDASFLVGNHNEARRGFSQLAMKRCSFFCLYVLPIFRRPDQNPPGTRQPRGGKFRITELARRYSPGTGLSCLHAKTKEVVRGRKTHSSPFLASLHIARPRAGKLRVVATYACDVTKSTRSPLSSSPPSEEADGRSKKIVTFLNQFATVLEVRELQTIIHRAGQDHGDARKRGLLAGVFSPSRSTEGGKT